MVTSADKTFPFGRSRFLPLPAMWRPLVFASIILALLGVFPHTNAVAAPTSDLLQRDRIEDPLFFPQALYSNELSFVSNPRFQSSYIGDPNRIIASSGSLQISARELFCYLMTVEHPSPTIVEGYDLARTKLEAEDFRRQIRKAVRSYFATVRLAAAYRGPLTEIEQKEVEILTLSAWQTAWTMRYIEPQITLEANDIVRAYRKNRDTFFYPEQATFRALIVPFDRPEEPKEKVLEALPVEERDAQRKQLREEIFGLQSQAIDQLEQLRQQILAGEINFEAAASRLADETGVPQGQPLPGAFRGQLATQVESVVFETTPGELTPVIPVRDGAVLLYIESIKEARFAQLEEVATRAEELARRQAAKFLFNRELEFVSPRTQISDPRTWEQAEPDTIIVEVDNFILTKEELLQLYPGFEDGDTFLPRQEELGIRVKRLAMLAHIRRDALSRGLSGDPLVQRSRRIAEWVVRSKRTLSDRMEKFMGPDETRTEAYYETNPELFTPAPRYHLIELGAVPDENVPAQLAPEVSRRIVEDFIALAKQEGARHQAAGSPMWHRSPEVVAAEEAGRRLGLIKAPKFREGEEDAYDYARPVGVYPYTPLAQYSTEFVTIGDRTFAGDIYYKDLGFVFLTDVAVYADDLRELKEREYSPVRLYGGVPSAFYVMEIEQPETPPFEEVANMAAQEYALQQRSLFVSRLMDSYEDRAPIDFQFERSGPENFRGK